MSAIKPIILDCLGGDDAVVDNSAAAHELITRDREKIPLLLVGPEKEIRDQLTSLGTSKLPDTVEIFDCHEQFSSERSATEVVREGKASIVCALQLLKEGRGRAVVSAGHTGATFVSSLMVLGRLPGVHRPALAIIYPSVSGPTVMLDVGANVDAKSAHLVSFALMGAVYYAHAYKISPATVGLLTIGEEALKGTAAVVSAHQDLLKFTSHPWITFKGSVDGSEIFGNCPNVLVTDGFVGNLLVKSVESLVSRFEYEFKTTFSSSNIITKLGFLLSKHVWKSVKTGLDYRDIGGAPLLGVNGDVLVCHGRSDGPTIAQAVRKMAHIDLESFHGTLSKVLVESREILKGETQ